MGDAAKELPCPGSAVSYSGRSEVALLLYLLHIVLLHKQDLDAYSATSKWLVPGLTRESGLYLSDYIFF